MSDRLDEAIGRVDAQRRDRAERASDEQRAFLAEHPFDEFHAELRTRLAAADAPAPRHSGRRWWAVALGGAAAAVVVAGLWFVLGVSGDGATVRLKGGGNAEKAPASNVGLSFFVRAGDGAVPGRNGGTYRAGDRFRFTYTSGANDYLVLLSVEDGGDVTVFYPDATGREGSGRSMAIARGRNVPLEDSVVLNEYVGKERFFAVFSTNPLDVAVVRRAAAEALRATKTRGGGIEVLDRLPIDAPQASFWIRKE